MHTWSWKQADPKAHMHAKTKNISYQSFGQSETIFGGTNRTSKRLHSISIWAISAMGVIFLNLKLKDPWNIHTYLHMNFSSILLEQSINLYLYFLRIWLSISLPHFAQNKIIIITRNYFAISKPRATNTRDDMIVPKSYLVLDASRSGGMYLSKSIVKFTFSFSDLRASTHVVTYLKWKDTTFISSNLC